MARAIAPVVVFMLAASSLFVAAGLLDGIYPGGPAWSFTSYGGIGWTSYAFGLINLLVAVFIARGSERSLALRIGLAVVFVLERTTTAFFPVAKSLPSVGVHLATALIELVILAMTLRVYRLGHAVGASDLELLTLPAATPAFAGAGAGALTPPAAAARPALADRGRALRAAPAATARRIPAAASRAIAILAFFLAGALVVDALLAGAIPGVTVDPLAPAALAYVYALGILLIAAFAVSGRRLSLLLLLLVALILFLERALMPLAVGGRLDATGLGVHAIGALLALVLAFVCAAALRRARSVTAAS